MRKRENSKYQSRHQTFCHIYSRIHTWILSIQLQWVRALSWWICEYWTHPYIPSVVNKWRLSSLAYLKWAWSTIVYPFPSNNLCVGFCDFASVSTDEDKDKESYSPVCTNWTNSMVSVLLTLWSRCSNSQNSLQNPLAEKYKKTEPLDKALAHRERPYLRFLSPKIAHSSSSPGISYL